MDSQSLDEGLDIFCPDDTEYDADNSSDSESEETLQQKQDQRSNELMTPPKLIKLDSDEHYDVNLDATISLWSKPYFIDSTNPKIVYDQYIAHILRSSQLMENLPGLSSWKLGCGDPRTSHGRAIVDAFREEHITRKKYEDWVGRTGGKMPGGMENSAFINNRRNRASFYKQSMRFPHRYRSNIGNRRQHLWSYKRNSPRFIDH